MTATAAKILVVEDEGIVGLELSEALRRMGYEVLPVVASGHEAIDKALIDHPDLILMDIRIEGEIDGIETARKIRNDFQVPVIYLTAHSDETTLQRAKYTETYGYLLKPFEERSLHATIEMALYKSQKEREMRKSHEWDETILKSLADGIMISDTKGVIQYVNERAASLTRLQAAGCRGKNITQVINIADPDSHAHLSLPVTQIIIEGTTVSGKRVLLQPGDGSEISIEYTLSPIKNSNGNTAGIILLLHTVGVHEQREEAIRFELERSKQYQQNLLPEKKSVIHGIKTSWLFYPSVFGSGDIFNMFPLSSSVVGFYLLDVMGHGFSAAVLSLTIYSFLSHDIARMGICKRANTAGGGLTLEDDKTDEILTPTEVIKELNKRFFFRSNDNPFFTLIYGTIDTAKQKGTIARAGHLYPFLHRKGREIERLKSEGQAIGVFPEISITEKEFDFCPGDRLYMYSDGFLDLVCENAEFSDNVLVNMIQKHGGKDLETLCGTLEKTLKTKPMYPDFNDDIAFFAIEQE